MYHPLVTIVIPVYKGEDFVGQAIQSALNQTYDNIEILVINDGSPDNGGSRRAVEPYLDKVKYFEKENGGVSSVLNLAFEIMNGEWLSWLSHDDLYYPDKVKMQIEYINKKITGLDLNKTVIFSDSDFIDEFGNKIKLPTRNQITPSMSTEQLIISNIKRNSMGGCTFLIPRYAYTDIGGFSEKLRTISDFDYWYRLLFAGYQFHYIPEVLTSNRMHSQQVTYKSSDLAQKESEEFHEYVVKQLARSSQYRRAENFLNVAYYMSCKGIKNVPDLAYGYALQCRNDALIRTQIVIHKILSKVHYISRSIAKAFYIKHVVFRAK